MEFKEKSLLYLLKEMFVYSLCALHPALHFKRMRNKKANVNKVENIQASIYEYK